MFRPTLEAFVRGEPAAHPAGRVRRARMGRERAASGAAARTDRRSRLCLDAIGGEYWGGVVDVLDPKLQAAITELRTAGLNIMMSMKDAGKPISFVEDCAVPLEHLADYTARLTEVFRQERHHRHLVRPRLGRLPACAADPQPAARQGRQGDARHRRAGLRVRARIQGLALRRARRRPGALGIQRADVRLAARPRVRGGEGPLRSERRCSIPARSCARRSSTTAPTSATARATRRSR